GWGEERIPPVESVVVGAWRLHANQAAGNRSNEASAAKATARRAQTRAFPSLASRSAASAIANSFSICSNLTPCIMSNVRYQVSDKKGTVPFLVWPDCLERC